MDDNVFLSNDYLDDTNGSIPIHIPSKHLRRVMSSVDVSPNSPDSFKEFFCKCYKEHKNREKSVGETEMLQDVDESNAFIMFQMANSYDCAKLQETSLKVILENFNTLFHSRDFKDLCKYDLQILLQDPRIEQTGVGLDVILNTWYIHEPDARYSDFVKLCDMFIGRKSKHDSVSSNTECLWQDSVPSSPIHSDISQVFKRQRFITHIAILYEIDKILHFSVIKARDPSHVVSWIEAPPLGKHSRKVQLCVASFCRTEHIFLRAKECMLAYNVYKLQWRNAPMLKHGVVGAGFVGNEHTIYSIGGREIRKGMLTNTVSKYNMKNKKWKDHGKLEKSVHNPACVAYKGDIYIFGGSCEGEINTDHVQIYCPDKKRTKNCQTLPVTVSGGQCVVSSHRIFIATPQRTLLEYDPNSNEVVKVCSIDLEADHFEIVSDTHLIYFIEGNSLSGYVKLTAYYPKTGGWYCCGYIPAVEKLHGTVSFPYNPI